MIETEQIQLTQLQENVRAMIVAVQRSGNSVPTSEKGIPIVKIVPISSAEPSWLGCMKDKEKIVSDIVYTGENQPAQPESADLAGVGMRAYWSDGSPLTSRRIIPGRCRIIRQPPLQLVN